MYSTTAKSTYFKTCKERSKRPENKAGYFHHYIKLAMYMKLLNQASINLIAMLKSLEENKFRRCVLFSSQDPRTVDMKFEVLLMTMKAPIKHLYLSQIKHVTLCSNQFCDCCCSRFLWVEVAQILVLCIAVTSRFSTHKTWRNANGILWLTDKHHIKQACCSLQVKVMLLKLNTIFWKLSFRLRIITTVQFFL